MYRELPGSRFAVLGFSCDFHLASSQLLNVKHLLRPIERGCQQ
jgi:hypothetical protein